MFPKSYFVTVASSIIVLLISTISRAQLPFTQHPDPPGVPVTLARMNDLVIDASNNKWIAFGNYGVGVYDGTAWGMFNMANSGMPSDSATSIAFDLSGNPWIGTNAGLVYKSGTTFNVYNTGNSSLPSNIVTSLLTVGTNAWIGTLNGLASFNGTNWTIYQTGNSGLVNDSITSLDVDAGGVLWIGTRNGLNSFDGTTWNSFTTGNSPLNNYIIDVTCDAFGRTWVSDGTRSFNQTIYTTGVHYVQNGMVKDFLQDIYFYELPVTYPNAVNIAKDGSGNVWFRANIHAQGIVKVESGTFEFYVMSGINQGIMAYGSIFQLDQSGVIWTVPRNRFYFYSLDPAGYIPQLEMLNYKNHRQIDINDVNAGINVMGDMHWDLTSPGYEVPKGSGKHSIFASAFWIGGLDPGGQVHVSGQTYRQTGSDYWPGPISGISVPFDTNSCIQFNEIWKIDKWKIEEFKNEFAAGNVTNGTYPVPAEIATWPAKGNGIVVDDMAPYVDFNNNGSYNPIDGDYPLIKGDQMLYYIFNDSLGVQTATGGGPRLGIEVRASVYAYNCTGINDSNQVLNWTTLYHYDILNRSINDYDGVSMGIWTDTDLGFYADDIVGCDTTLSSAFVYDGDNDDGVYGINPPMQNVKVLRGTLADIGDGIDNDVDGTIDEPGEHTSMNSFMVYNNVNNIPNGNPNGPADYYNLMNATWLDNSPLTYGGSGYNSSNILTDFMFSGIPFSGSGWTELTAGNVPEDRRFILASGPFSLDAGDTATFDFAYVFTWDSLSPNGVLTSIARNQADLQRVQTWFENNSFPSCEIYSVGVDESANELSQLSIHPNPATEKLYVSSDSGSLYGMNYAIFNLLGEEIMHGKLNSNQINISALPSQVYLLKIDLKSGSEYVRFVKIVTSLK